MPATTIHRVVRNTSVVAGGLYYFERDGALLRPLPNSGLKLKPDATNGVWIYRVASPSGVPLTMVGPATLSVYYKDPEALAAQVLIGTYTAATFDATDKCFKFDLSATDFSAYNGRELEYRFADSSVASVTASIESVVLYERRIGDSLQKVGTWKILSAIAAGLPSKRVRFESSNPSVCRIERGEIASSYLQVAGEQAQADQYCVLIGVGVGTCEIRCISEDDENQTDTVSVEVRTHPDDAPVPGSTDEASVALAAAFSGIRIGIASSAVRGAYDRYNAAGDAVCYLDLRQIVVPGSQEDLFKVTANVAGDVPKRNEYATGDLVANNQWVLFLCLSDSGIGYLVHDNNSVSGDDSAYKEIARDLGAKGCFPLNSSGSGAETLDMDLSFLVRGGEVISFGFALARCDAGAANAPQQPPDAMYDPELNITVDTYYPPKDAPA